MLQEATKDKLLKIGRNSYVKGINIADGTPLFPEVFIKDLPIEIIEQQTDYVPTIPTVYDLFDSQKAENDLLEIFFDKLTDYRIDKGYISVLMRNKTKDSFRFFKVYIYKLLKENVISQEDYDNSISVITSQNIII